MFGNYNQPYYMQPQLQRTQPMEPQYPQYNTNNFTKPVGLLGKSVDSIDVVRAMDIPLDGSISYFPLTDGSAIVTKQLQNDGTSKTVVYKPTTEGSHVTKYLTSDDLTRIEDDIQKLKDNLKSITDTLNAKGD